MTVFRPALFVALALSYCIGAAAQPKSGLNSAGAPVFLFDSLHYADKPAADALHSKGYAKIYLLPASGGETSNKLPYQPFWWRYGSNAYPKTDLQPADRLTVAEIASNICSRFTTNTEPVYIAYDIEWFFHWTNSSQSPPGDPSPEAQAGLNVKNLSSVMEITKGVFEDGPCQGKIRLGLYGTPNKFEDGRLTYPERHALINEELRRQMRDHVDFVAPVFYMHATPGQSFGGEEWFDFWKNNTTQWAEEAKRWGVPIIPFIGVRWFPVDCAVNGRCETLLEPEHLTKMLTHVSNAELGAAGYILWDADVLTLNKPVASPWTWGSRSNWLPFIQQNFSVGSIKLDISGARVGSHYDVGNIVVGEAFSTPVIRVANVGGGDLVGFGLTISQGWTLSSANSPDDPDCVSGVLQAGSSCALRLTTTRATAGEFSSVLSVNGNSETVLSLYLSGSAGSLPSLALTYPGEINFGSVPSGQTYNSSSVTLRNNGAGAATGLNVSASGVFAIGSNSCGSTLAPNSSCNFVVQFSPTAGVNQSYSGTLQIGASGLNTVARQLSGAGTAPTFTLSYASDINFGSAQAGQTYNSDVTTLVNNSNVTATGLSVSATGVFSIGSNACGATLAPNTSCTFVIRFSPTAGQNQSYTGTLHVSAAGAVPITRALSGTGVAPTFSLSYPGAINFGGTPAGETANSDVTTLFNNSSVAATGLSVSASGVFSIGSNMCGTTLAPNTSCTFVIRFSPTAGQSQSYTGTLQVSAAGVTPLTRPLSGSGSAPTFSLSYPGAINFGSTPAGDTANSDVTTLLNNSGITANGLNVSAAGAFSIGNNTCGTTLAPNTSCTFVIRFSPTAGQNQSYTGTLQVSAAGATTVSRPLSGTGVAPTFSLSYPGAVNFGSAPAGQTYNSDVTTLANNSSVTANGLSVSASGVFSIGSNTCGTTLAPNTSCTFVIRFSPTAGQIQSYTGTLQVSAAGAAPVSRPLSGSGTAPILSLSYPSAINFGSAPAGQTYNSDVTTLVNNGNVTATELSVSTSGVFSIGSNTCGTTLAPNTSCTFVIRFSPTAGQNQGYTGTLQVSTANASPLTRPLSGTGTVP